MKGLAEVSADINKLLKMFKNIDPQQWRLSLIERIIYCELSVYQQLCDEKKEGNHHEHISEKCDISCINGGEALKRLPMINLTLPHPHEWEREKKRVTYSQKTFQEGPSRRRCCYCRRWKLHACHCPFTPLNGTRCGGGRHW